MTMVSVADLVVRLPGESKGADAEVAEARRRGIPVVYSVESIGAQIRQDYTWAEHQAANQATLDEMAAAMGAKR
jgi:ABC-type sugar transport system substrate-binding protein